MKQLKLSVFALVLTLGAYAQVGVNTTTPQTTLDIIAKNPTGTATNVDGILLPKVDRERMQSMTSVPTGTLVYCDNIATGTSTGTTVNVTQVGYYFYNATQWDVLVVKGLPTGGTTGQVLSKVNGTDYNVQWSTAASSTDPLEFNTTNLTVWNNGKGNVDLNTSFGQSALRSNTTAEGNTAIGHTALLNTSTGGSNTAVGLNVLSNNTSGINNTAIGVSALQSNTTGIFNTAIGSNAGSFLAYTAANDSTPSYSVYLGAQTSALAAGQTNQIIIGYNAIGAGSNTATLGNTAITRTVLRGTINVAGLAIYGDNAAAITGGLLVGDMYRTNTGVLMVRF